MGSGGSEGRRWLERLGAGSAMGGEVAAFAWDRTTLGDPSSWPAELRALVQLCLTTRFPMLVTWGSQLSMIYNDGYRDMLGDKHPSALGAPLAEVWAEIWDVIGPLVGQVMATGKPTWSDLQRLLIVRRGFVEETFFTFSYSPAVDAEGRARGLVDLATETTAQVVAQRRLVALASLGEAVFSASQVTGVCLAAIEELAVSLDVVNADVFLGVGDEPVLIASTRRFERAPITSPLLRTVLTEQTTELVRAGGSGTELTPPAGVAVPLGAGDSPRGVLYVEPAPTAAFTAEYRAFLDQVAASISRALATADTRAVELGEQRRINATLQQAMLQPASDHPTVAARYRPAALNLAVGGDWYDVIDLDEHRRAMVVGDCVGHGLEAATAMGQLRSAARALLLEHHDDPATVLEHLDMFSASIPGALAASVVCVIIDRLAGSVSYSRAGHPPPLLIDRGGVRWLDAAGGCLLAVLGEQPRPLATADYADGDLLVLYTDGLVERRGEAIDEGLDRLAALAARCFERGASAADTADGLLRELLPSRGGDDVVLVVKRLIIDQPGCS